MPFILNEYSTAQISQNINQYDKQGKKHGIWKAYHENTQTKRYEGEFNHGTPVGRFTYYAIEGNVSGKVDFINDSISSAQMFHDNGSIMAEGKFLNQTKSGKWYIYSRSGYLLNVLHLLNLLSLQNISNLVIRQTLLKIRIR